MESLPSFLRKIERPGCGRGEPAPRAPLSGFTLLELLIVVGIITFMAVIALPNMVSSLRALQITQAGQLVETQLQTARQKALADNRAVQVRFYKFAPPTGGSAYFTALQPFIVSTSGAPTAADRPYYLPGNMIMDSGNNQSTDNGSTLSTILGQTATSSTNSLGTAQSYQYVTFQFNPDGSTNLGIGNNWFITVHAQTDGDNLKAAPKNYYTVQVDPYNGHIVDFHP